MIEPLLDKVHSALYLQYSPSNLIRKNVASSINADLFNNGDEQEANNTMLLLCSYEGVRY